MRRCSWATSASLTVWLLPTGDGPGDAELATRDGLAIATGEAALRSGVGIGVLTLRVSVAAAPGTGVGSAVSNDEHPDAAVAATSASATTARRTSTQAV